MMNVSDNVLVMGTRTPTWTASAFCRILKAARLMGKDAWLVIRRDKTCRAFI
jgi:hypothetical protein